MVKIGDIKSEKVKKGKKISLYTKKGWKNIATIKRDGLRIKIKIHNVQYCYKYDSFNITEQLIDKVKKSKNFKNTDFLLRVKGKSYNGEYSISAKDFDTHKQGVCRLRSDQDRQYPCKREDYVKIK